MASVAGEIGRGDCVADKDPVARVETTRGEQVEEPRAQRAASPSASQSQTKGAVPWGVRVHERGFAIRRMQRAVVWRRDV